MKKLILLLLFWGDNEFRVEGVKSKIRYAIYEKFRQHGVQIPFPQRDVHVRYADGVRGAGAGASAGASAVASAGAVTGAGTGASAAAPPGI